MSPNKSAEAKELLADDDAETMTTDSSQPVFFDADANIHPTEPFDYFDAMEVVYFEDMMHEKMPPLRKLRKDLKTRVDQEQQKLRRLAREQRKQFEQKLHKRRKKIRNKMSQPDFVMTIDKVSFVMGILIIMVTEFVLLVTPDKMGVLYTILLFPLMALRYLLYRMEKMHYFMYDFCYFVQVLMLFNLHKYPDSELLLKMNFAITNGPLAVAVIMWRNSLVFHSMDKMTSSFMHMLPALLTFCMRWQDYLLTKQFPLHESCHDTALRLARDFLVHPMACYVVWQTLYLCKTEIISKRKLEMQTELMTTLRWLTRNSKSASYKILTRFGKRHQLTSLVVYQGLYTVLTMLPTPLLWHSMRLHAMYLYVIFVVALTNGAAYYFHVFAVRYIDKVGSKNKEPATRENSKDSSDEPLLQEEKVD